MKVSIFICLIIFSIINLYSQSNNYPGLYSDDYEEILIELETITENHDLEAIPVLHSLIEAQSPYIQLNYLSVLSQLSDEKIVYYCLEFIKRADGFATNEYRENPLEVKVKASEILMQNDDFSTIDYVFDFFDLYKPDFNSLQIEVLDLFPEIAERDPARLTQIESDLNYVFNNSSIPENRYYALNIYEEIFNEDAQNMAMLAIYNTDYPLRMLALEILTKYNYVDLNNLLKLRLVQDPAPTLRTRIADTLLVRFGEPTDLKTIEDYQPLEPDETARTLISRSIFEFIPPRPEETISAFDMTNNLISYTDDLYTYQWIHTETKYKSYLSALNVIAKYIQRGLLDPAINDINQMLNTVESDYNSTPAITVEAYKFLHYHLQYIEDKLQ